MRTRVRAAEQEKRKATVLEGLAPLLASWQTVCMMYAVKRQQTSKVSFELRNRSLLNSLRAFTLPSAETVQ
ncbi:hypothetical protein [Nafulsella turpanensis]|uniref:hypothetical protein n=1 Tax=Nafulsella turpanensis TaxID=1265690 RepID=UPI000346A573|nr:hypothetical protein [Nafulsella turpanensis]